MSEPIQCLINIISIFTVLSIGITIALELLIHKHIIELKFPMKWRFTIYINVWAVLSLQLGVLLHHYQQYFVTALILACPIYVGYTVGFLKTI